jgi:hypothetical protein
MRRDLELIRNNIHLQRYLPECDQVVKGDKAALQFFISYQQLAETIEPTVRNLDHPSSGLFVRVVYELNSLLSAPLDVRDKPCCLMMLSAGAPV